MPGATHLQLWNLWEGLREDCSSLFLFYSTLVTLNPCSCVCKEYIRLARFYLGCSVLFASPQYKSLFFQLFLLQWHPQQHSPTKLLCGLESAAVESIALCGGWCKKTESDSHRVGASSKSEQSLCFTAGTWLTFPNHTRKKRVICLWGIAIAYKSGVCDCCLLNAILFSFTPISSKALVCEPRRLLQIRSFFC